MSPEFPKNNFCQQGAVSQHLPQKKARSLQISGGVPVKIPIGLGGVYWTKERFTPTPKSAEGPREGAENIERTPFPHKRLPPHETFQYRVCSIQLSKFPPPLTAPRGKRRKATTQMLTGSSLWRNIQSVGREPQVGSPACWEL